ncbi:D-alanine--D-alanine ligase family protein [Paenibacillus pinihumi]|uniref:D-alanine--D-alanine ligase family protein n=1 Tax=Paenibacillus pinihumi TaxID=669462 RepID=UPI0004051DF2|nr:D-alanine--D-alanine ligase family protein [Paenibacillus pinihumi]
MATILYVLYGGKSVEHEISLKTAFTVLQSIDYTKFEVYPIYITQNGYWCSQGRMETPAGTMEELRIVPEITEEAASLGDILTRWFRLDGNKVALPLLHGSNGEDGTIQGLFELLDIAYVGNGVLGSAAALDKAVTKSLLAEANIPQVAHQVYHYPQWLESGHEVMKAIEQGIAYPCYVKPASLGSSIGISRCENASQLRNGIKTAFLYDRKIVVEKEVAGREIQVAVMGNDRPLVSLPGEFIQDQAFFDFDAKYVHGRLTMSIPAEIPDAVKEQLQQYALQAYQALNGAGLARVDFFLDQAGRLYLNEINTLPGFTKFSMYPVMWERTNGTPYSGLIEKLIDYAFMRHADKQAIQYTR